MSRGGPRSSPLLRGDFWFDPDPTSPRSRPRPGVWPLEVRIEPEVTTQERATRERATRERATQQRATQQRVVSWGADRTSARHAASRCRSSRMPKAAGNGRQVAGNAREPLSQPLTGRVR
nr:hypothetical protein Ade03nite_86750 [Actinoplanes derwentensis]